MVRMFVSRVGIFFIHLLNGKLHLIGYCLAMAEAVFYVLLCFNLVELGVDEGFALIAVDGI